MKLTHTPIPTHIFLELKQATVFLLNNSSHELKKKIIIQRGDEQWVFSALLDKGKHLTQYGKRRYQARISRLHKPIYDSCSTPPHSSFPATKCHGDISLFVIICNLQTVTGSFCLFHQSFSWLSSTYGSTAQETLRRDSSELHEALCKLLSGFWCG